MEEVEEEEEENRRRKNLIKTIFKLYRSFLEHQCNKIVPAFMKECRQPGRRRRRRGETFLYFLQTEMLSPANIFAIKFIPQSESFPHWNKIAAAFRKRSHYINGCN